MYYSDIFQQMEVEPMQVSSEGGEEKKMPTVREGKLRRTALPLVPPVVSNRYYILAVKQR